MKKQYYGGAYDIDPYSYWTKDDLVALQYSIQNRFDPDCVVITGVYESDDVPNQIEVDYESENGDGTVNMKIDMRKVKSVGDLLVKYTDKFAYHIQKEVYGTYEF